MSDFYVDTIRKLIDKSVLRRDMKILVVCGGDWDKNALLECGFTNVVISNLDTRMDGHDYLPFQWSFQDAEKLDFDDDQFDVCIAHSGLHHCRSPHGALLENVSGCPAGRYCLRAGRQFHHADGRGAGLGFEDPAEMMPVGLLAAPQRWEFRHEGPNRVTRRNLEILLRIVRGQRGPPAAATCARQEGRHFECG